MYYSPDETKTESISGVLRKPIGPDLGPEFEVWGGGINSLDNLLKIREIHTWFKKQNEKYW